MLIWPSIFCYSLFGIFAFYHKLHAKEFRGESEFFRLVLNVSAFCTFLVGVAYLILYGWIIVWWAPFVVFIIGILATFIGVLLEFVLGKLILGLLGFIGWPVCAYFMFYFILTV